MIDLELQSKLDTANERISCADGAESLARGVIELMQEAGGDLAVVAHALGRLRGDYAAAEAVRAPTRLERMERQLDELSENVSRIADALQGFIGKQTALENHCAQMHGPTAVKG